MCRPSWEAPHHAGLQPAALCSLECGALGRGEAPAWTGLESGAGSGPGAAAGQDSHPLLLK